MPLTPKRSVLKIFISSPGDVEKERELAVKVIRELNEDLEVSKDFELLALRWEEATPPIATEAPQVLVNENLGLAAGCDIFVCIFGQKFGTKSQFAGRSYPSGTYYEFQSAENANEDSADAKPAILLYRMIRNVVPEPGTEAEDQARKVDEFFRTRPIKCECYTLEEFGNNLRVNLKKAILKQAPSSRSLNSSFLRTRIHLGFHLDDRKFEHDLLEKVWEIWIRGVLREVTARGGGYRIETLIRENQRRGGKVSTSREILKLFRDYNHQLVILGPEGSGKSVQLLRLVQELIKQVRQDTDRRSNFGVPVIFNLSSWAKHHGSIENWLISELTMFYRLPQKIAKRLVRNQKLILCLDGLDEITVADASIGSQDNDIARTKAAELKKECIDALNTYLDSHRSTWIILCCRQDEYLSSSVRLTKRDQDIDWLTIEHLEQGEIDNYFDRSLYRLASLRSALEQNAVLREMANTPFFLTTMAIAYNDEEHISSRSILEGARGEESARQIHLFEQYIVIRGRGLWDLQSKWDIFEIQRYLHNLALKMEAGESKLLLIEYLQPNWLPQRSQRMYRFFMGILLFIFITITTALPSGLAIGIEWATSPGKTLAEGLKYGLACAGSISLAAGGISGIGFAFCRRWWFGVALGLAFGIARGLVSGFSEFEGGVQSGIRTGLWTAIVSVPVLGSLVHLRTYKQDEVRPLESHKWDGRRALKGIASSIIVSIVMWIIFGPARGLGFGLALTLVLALAFGELGSGFEIKAYPNQGIIQSRRLALQSAITFAIVGSICFGMSYGMFSQSSAANPGRSFQQGVVNGVLGLSLSVCSLMFGVLPFLQHFAVRWALACKKVAPVHIEKFLHICTRLGLLRRVGGGFMFHHESLREYFKNLHTR